MELIHKLRAMLHDPQTPLNDFGTAHPVAVYAVLVAIVFCETGLVVLPFLPGDSLLFAVGALAAGSGVISLPLVIVLLCVAANCGDLVNYFIGRAAGPKVFSRKTFLLNPKHLNDAQAFYEKHGRKTIIIARFVPIVRTFAPFVAGVGRMEFGRFIGFSVFGGLLWVVSMTVAGYLFGTRQWVKDHFEIVVLAIVFISLIPVLIHAVQGRRKGTIAAVPVTTPVE